MIDTGKTSLHTKVFKLVNPDRSLQLSVTRFREVTRLVSGCSFGELALLKTRGRAATIQCAMPSKFAIVDQKDYLKTVGLEENLKLKKIVSFFRSFRVFEKVKPMDMQRIQKHMKQVKFIRGQKVFTEGSSKTDGLYFIESGDF